MTDFTKKQRLFGAMIPELWALVEPQCKRDATWEEIIELAERHDAALYQAQKQSKEKHRSPNLRKLQHNNASNNNNNANKPHSGNTNKGSPNKFKKYMKLTPKLREQLIKEGKCFYCQETGHQVANCPKAKKKLNNDW